MSNARLDHQIAVRMAMVATVRTEETLAGLVKHADEALLLIIGAVGESADTDAQDAKRWMAEIKQQAQECIRFTQNITDKLKTYEGRW